MKLTPESINKFNPAQLQLLDELGDLARKEAELNAIIENHRHQAEKVGIGRDRENIKSILDDPEYDNLLSIKSIKEREQVKEKIRSVMQSLIEAGLGELDIIKRQAANYGLKIGR